MADASSTPRTQKSEYGNPPEGQDWDASEYVQIVTRHPLASLMVGFGLGFGLGVLAIAVFRPDEENWLERHGLPGSLHDLSSNLRRVPGMLAEHLPESLTRR